MMTKSDPNVIKYLAVTFIEKMVSQLISYSSIIHAQEIESRITLTSYTEKTQWVMKNAKTAVTISGTA